PQPAGSERWRAGLQLRRPDRTPCVVVRTDLPRSELILGRRGMSMSDLDPGPTPRADQSQPERDGGSLNRPETVLAPSEAQIGRERAFVAARSGTLIRP